MNAVKDNYRTLVVGASNKPGRFSYLAIKSLVNHSVEVYAIGARIGNVDGVEIITQKIDINNIHTVTLYLNPKNQASYIDYIIGLKPKRVIFNPGTENPELLSKARENN
ncbi:MAG TPA: CoA-binding protein, partial [Tenuifilaceae bacterium]|nr:CoA-binding protein [Tenuifilaceae bacterium]